MCGWTGDEWGGVPDVYVPYMGVGWWETISRQDRFEGDRLEGLSKGMRGDALLWVYINKEKHVLIDALIL